MHSPLIPLTMRAALLIFGLFLYMGFHSGASAQERVAFGEGTVRIVLTDGSAVVGRIVEQTDDAVTVVTTDDIRMTIPRERIRSIESFEGRRFAGVDPNISRILFSPTGRPIPSGSGYVATYELFLPFVAVGATDRLTLAGGISLFPGLGGQLVYAAPKYTFVSRERFAVAGGFLASTFIGGGSDDDLPVVGVVYAVVTRGTSERSISGGTAFGYADGEFGRNPAFMIGGDLQVANNVKLISENYLIVGIDEGLLLSGGVRFFGERLAADLALVTSPAAFGEGGFPFIPWVGFAYNF